MSIEYARHDYRELSSPVLIIAMEGWIDAGIGAALAMGAVMSQLELTKIVTFDDNLLIDRRARRPTLRIQDGMNTGLTWTVPEMLAGSDAAGNDLIVLTGPEPDYQWGDFCVHVGQLSAEFGVRLVCGLGAFPAPVPHTRPVRVVATSNNADLAARVGFIPGNIEVPAGIEAVLERDFIAYGIPAVGLWARVPHYVAAMPYPEAGAALLDTLGDISGLRIDNSQLTANAAEARVRIDQLVANNQTHREMVALLEQQIDGAEEPEQPGLSLSAADLPSGDELAAELQRFLRGEI
ncbi:MAG: hypothetical protein QOG03_1922 [Actinomycetota bacterium]|nr:hypothetical protein [Actinomycetota bacterium]